MNFKNSKEKLVNNYFEAFSNKDLTELKFIFAENIQLIDWTTKLKGKKKVLLFNKKLFNKFKKIKVKVIDKFYNNKKNSIACKIEVNLNKKKLNVVDIIYFNSKYKINKIIAYLG